MLVADHADGCCVRLRRWVRSRRERRCLLDSKDWLVVFNGPLLLRSTEIPCFLCYSHEPCVGCYAVETRCAGNFCNPRFVGRVYEDRALQRTFEPLGPLAGVTEVAILEDGCEQGTLVMSSQCSG